MRMYSRGCDLDRYRDRAIVDAIVVNSYDETLLLRIHVKIVYFTILYCTVLYCTGLYCIVER
jgi:hypothetical protein